MNAQDEELYEMARAALEADGYQVERMVDVVQPDDPTGLTEAVFVDKEGHGDWAYMRPLIKDGERVFRVVNDPP